MLGKAFLLKLNHDSYHNWGPKSYNRHSNSDSLEMNLFCQVPLNSPTIFFYFSGPQTMVPGQQHWQHLGTC